MYTRFYSLEGMLDPSRDVDARTISFLIEEHVLPDTWTKNGGSCVYGPVPGGLMIHGGTKTHELTASLLAQLGRAMDSRVMDHEPFAGSSEARRRIEKKLTEPTELKLKEKPLTDVAEEITKRHGVPILFHRRPLEDAGIIPEDTLITRRLRDVPLHTALDTVLGEFGSAFIIDPSHQLLILTSRDDADHRLSTRVHRIGGLARESARITPQRLVESIENIYFANRWQTGMISSLGDTLVVTESENMHRKVRQILDNLAQFSVDPPRRWDYNPSPLKALAAAMRRKLDEPTKLAFQETPLSDVLTFISESHQLQMQINRRALEDAGIVPEDTLLTRSLKGVPLRSALRLMLEVIGLDFIVFPDQRILLVTSQDDADAAMSTRFYGLRGILGGQSGLSSSDRLIQLIQTTIRPDSWEDAGGPGVLLVLGDTLVVSQSQRGQRQVRQLLQGLSRFFGEGESGDVMVGTDATYARVQAALDKPTKLVADDLVLADVITLLRRSSKTNFFINRRALKDVGIVPEDTPVNLKVRDVPLREVLTRVCQPLKLDSFVTNHVILITSADDAESTPAPITLYRMTPKLREAISAEELRLRIKAEVLPHTWADKGGAGEIEVVPGGLLVAPVQASADEVKRLVERLRKQFESDSE